MQGNKARDTSPELAVRKLLHAQGLRYRVNYRPLKELRRTADIAFTRKKIAVLIDGCFWHGCPDHYTRPAANREFWDAKIARNKTRDAETDRAFTAAGWTVLRFWEHRGAEEVAGTIVALVLGGEVAVWPAE
jgi:DNA mismatch endonuclease (patch repair protein)